MEQYSNQQQVIVEPAKTKKPTGLQTAALVIGIIGLAFAFVAYFGTIFSNIGLGIAVDQNVNMHGFGVASGVIFAVDAFLALLCLVGLILGIAGLVKSIRRATRTVKGIVMSAIGLTCSEAGLALMIVGMVVGGVFRILIESGAFH